MLLMQLLAHTSKKKFDDKKNVAGGVTQSHVEKIDQEKKKAANAVA